MTGVDPSRLEAVAAEIGPDAMAQRANDGAGRGQPAPPAAWLLVGVIVAALVALVVAVALIVSSHRL